MRQRDMYGWYYIVSYIRCRLTLTYKLYSSICNRCVQSFSFPDNCIHSRPVHLPVGTQNISPLWCWVLSGNKPRHAPVFDLSGNAVRMFPSSCKTDDIPEYGEHRCVSGTCPRKVPNTREGWSFGSWYHLPVHTGHMDGLVMISSLHKEHLIPEYYTPLGSVVRSVMIIWWQGTTDRNRSVKPLSFPTAAVVRERKWVYRPISVCGSLPYVITDLF